MAELSRRALGKPERGGAPNLLYVRAAVEAVPEELLGIASELTVVLPWGSLLAAVLRPELPALRGMRALCRPGASLEVVLASDEARDAAELVRLGIGDLQARLRLLPAAYAEAGFEDLEAREVASAELAAIPSTWARRIGRARRGLRLRARASGLPGQASGGSGAR